MLIIFQLKTMGKLVRECDPKLTVVEQDLKDAANFFNSACLPGPWAPDAKTDKIYSKLQYILTSINLHNKKLSVRI